MTEILSAVCTEDDSRSSEVSRALQDCQQRAGDSGGWVVTLFTSDRKGQSCDLSIKCFALTYSRRPC